MNATDEQQHHGVRLEPDLGPGITSIPRAEHVEVHPRIDHAHPCRIRAIQVNEVLRFLIGVGNQGRGGLDDLLLTDLAAPRFAAVALRQLLILHPGHGVHGVHERHVPPVGGQPADLT